ncbi:MAG: hypothetical protein QW197_00295 [Candidatus Aenigmatarchaeota archaeon]
MKNYIFLIAFLFVASVSLSELNVNYQILEKEIYPNSFATLILNLQNPTKNEIRSISIIFESEDKNIEIIPKEFELESLAANSQFSQSFLIKIGSNAKTSNIRAYISYYSDSEKKDFVIFIPIKILRNPILIVRNINFSQDYLEIGKSINVSLEVYNAGYSSAKDLKIKIIPQASLIVSSDEIYVKEIRVGESFVTTFTISSMPEIPPAYYYVQLILTYFNEDFPKIFNESKLFSIKVFSEPKIDVYIDDISGNIVTLRIINIGLSKAKNLMIHANEKTYIIDKLDAGEDESIDLTSNTNFIRIKVEYFDTFNEKRTFSKNITLSEIEPYNISIPRNIQRAFPRQQNNITSNAFNNQTIFIFVGIFIVLIIFFLIYRKYLKRKKK